MNAMSPHRFPRLGRPLYAAACASILFAMLGSAANAQVVSPRHFARVEGDDESYDPITSNATLFRYQQVHDDMVGTPRTVNSLTFRLSDSESTAAINLQATVYLSEAAAGIGSTNLSTTFDANHGANKATVANAVFFNFPAATYDAGRDLWPRAFTHRMLFPTPFAYSGARPLVWEIQTLSRQNLGARGRLDAASGATANPNPWFVLYTERTCRTGTGQNAVVLNYGDTVNWSSGNIAISLGARYLLPNQSAVALLGLSNQTFAGLPLPYVLPGSTTAPSGTCLLAASGELQLPGSSSGTGTFSFNTNLPVLANANGRRFFMQVAGLAPAANPTGIVTSDAAYIQILAPFTAVPVGTVSLPGSLGAVGRVYTNYGLVTELR